MNEEAKDDSSVLGKAVSVAAVGGGVYGVHKGVTSNSAYNWASGRNASGRGNMASKGVKKYNDIVKDFKDGYHEGIRKKNGGGNNIVNGSWESAETVQTKQAQKILNVVPNKKLLKEGLNAEALKNQIHLDNLRNATKSKNMGNVVETIAKAL